MILNLELLKQNNCRLQIVWIAATRGINYINQGKLLELNIEILSDDIQNYIKSHSKHEQHKFSLRFSSILLNGLLRIHKKRVEIFLKEIFHILTTIHRPLTVGAPVKRKTSGPAVKVKKPRQTRVPERDSLESLLLNIDYQQPIQLPQPEPQILESNQDLITIRDTLLPQTDIIRRDFEDDGFGILTEEELKQLDKDYGASLAQTIPPPSPDKENDEITAYQIQVEAQIHPPPQKFLKDVPPQQYEEIAPQRPTGTFVVDEIVTLPSPAIVQSKSPEKENRKRKRLQGDDESKNLAQEYGLLINIKIPPKNIYIDRYKEGAFNTLMDIRQFKMPKYKIEDPNLTHLLNLFFIPENIVPSSHDLSHALKRETSTSVSRARDSRKPSDVEQIIPLTEVQQPSTPVMESTRIEAITTPTDAIPTTIERTVAVTHNKRQTHLEIQLPSLRETEFDVSFQEQIESQPYLIEAQNTVATETPLSLEARQQEIVNKVRNSLTSLSIEDLCVAEINKLNMARTFTDLLTLCKHGYVTLINEENSLNLKCIEKGSKML